MVSHCLPSLSQLTPVEGSCLKTLYRRSLSLIKSWHEPLSLVLIFDQMFPLVIQVSMIPSCVSVCLAEEADCLVGLRPAGKELNSSSGEMILESINWSQMTWLAHLCACLCIFSLSVLSSTAACYLSSLEAAWYFKNLPLWGCMCMFVYDCIPLRLVAWLLLSLH